MQTSKFLSMGKSEFYFIVRKNVAIHLELDGSFLLFESSTLSDGIYNQDGVHADEEITEFYTHLLEQRMHVNYNITVKDAIFDVLDNTHVHEMMPVQSLPKITKSVCDGLSKSLECATFIDCEDRFEFICFGTRTRIKLYLDSIQNDSFSCLPIPLYYATNFKGNVLAKSYLHNNMLMLSNSDKTMGGILLSVEVLKLNAYREFVHSQS